MAIADEIIHRAVTEERKKPDGSDGMLKRLLLGGMGGGGKAQTANDRRLMQRSTEGSRPFTKAELRRGYRKLGT